MDAGPDHGGGDAGGQVAVADQLYTGAGIADVRNQLLVAGTVEHDYHQVFHVTFHALGYVLQIVSDGRVQLHGIFARWSNHNLFHVTVGCVEQTASFGRGQHGNRARSAGGSKICPFQGVDGNIHLRNLGAIGKLSSHFFADI